VKWLAGVELVVHAGSAQATKREAITSNTDLIILIVVLLLLFGGGGYFWSRRR
jgi:hypothetical protein